jgi:hypothetical protein
MSKSRRIRAEQLLEPFATAEIEIPALGGAVLVRELSAAERTQVSALASRGQDFAEQPDSVDVQHVNIDAILQQMADLYPHVVAYGMQEPRMTLEEVKRIPGRFAEAFMEIGNRIMELSGMTEDEEVPEDVTDPKA